MFDIFLWLVILFVFVFTVYSCLLLFLIYFIICGLYDMIIVVSAVGYCDGRVDLTQNIKIITSLDPERLAFKMHCDP